MDLISAVTRVFRLNGIIRGDTDAPTSLSDLQHGASINLAVVAIQDELNELVSDRLIEYEYDNTGSIVTVAGTRTYSLPTNFVRFFGVPALYVASNNVNYYEYPGGLERLKDVHPDYMTQQATPQYWYFEPGTTKKIGFWPVPQEAKTYTFAYEQDVSVSLASDTMPFRTESEAQQFCRLASRRFKLLFEGMGPELLANDTEHMRAKSTLINLMRGQNPSRMWAPVYR